MAYHSTVSGRLQAQILLKNTKNLNEVCAFFKGKGYPKKQGFSDRKEWKIRGFYIRLRVMDIRVRWTLLTDESGTLDKMEVFHGH